jgi:asparagine synthase (glutamine-hydrolysing)
MCGIIGTLITAGSDSARRRLDTLDLCQSIAHRGPNGQGSHTYTFGDTQVRLGHTRLAIQDLSERGAQPMVSPSGRYCIVFNGEIYNHLELRRQFGVHSDTNNDCSTLCVLFEAIGIEKTLNLIEGIFALGIVDTKAQTLTLARDHFGVKPLYTYHDGHQFTFSSEIRGIRSVHPNLEPSYEDIYYFLRVRAPAPTTTLWKGLKKLLPGRRLVVNLRDLSSAPLEAVPLERETAPFTQPSDSYGSVLEQAVTRQLLSDTPVGVLLSGGIDSALLAQLAAAKLDNLLTFSVGFEGESDACELEYAEDTARILGSEHHSFRLRNDEAFALYRSAILDVEEPTSTTSIVAMKHLMRETSKHARVVLSGQGADEAVGGYSRYRALHPLVNTAPMRLGAKLASLASSRVSEHRLVKVIRSGDLAHKYLYCHELFTQEAFSSTRLEGYESAFFNQFSTGVAGPSRSDLSNRVMELDYTYNLAPDLLNYGDKISMAHGVEVRVPFLDERFVDYCSSLPLKQKVNLRKGKIIHREFAKSFLPTRIIDRPKKSFDVPVATWKSADWGHRVKEILLESPQLAELLPRATLADYFDADRPWSKQEIKQIVALSSIGILLEA